MKRMHIGVLAVVLVALGSAGAYAATATGQSAAGQSPSGACGGAQANCPPAKQAIANAQAAQRASAAAPAPKDPAANAAAAASLMNQPEPTPPTGIQDTHEGPFSPAQFAVANKWQGEVNGNWVEVYAGEIQADPDGSNAAAGKPGLRVQVFKGAWNGTLLGSTDYQVPGTTGGSAKITGQSNNVLTVVSSDGKQSKFDMTTNTVQ